jgi:hypothetical protein
LAARVDTRVAALPVDTRVLRAVRWVAHPAAFLANREDDPIPKNLVMAILNRVELAPVDHPPEADTPVSPVPADRPPAWDQVSHRLEDPVDHPPEADTPVSPVPADRPPAWDQVSHRLEDPVDHPPEADTPVSPVPADRPPAWDQDGHPVVAPSPVMGHSPVDHPPEADTPVSPVPADRPPAWDQDGHRLEDPVGHPRGVYSRVSHRLEDPVDLVSLAVPVVRVVRAVLVVSAVELMDHPAVLAYPVNPVVADRATRTRRQPV